MQNDESSRETATEAAAPTLRDMMAMNALTGLLSSGHHYSFALYDTGATSEITSHHQMDLERSREQSRRYAREAYLLADAMMAARAR